MFSVIIPLYNKEISIKNTIESVLNQTYQSFEIVVVNDGSNDNSAKIVESLNDKRVRLIHQSNQGVSAARNHGVKEARYEWIAFLDGDDLWEPNHLQEISEMMTKFPSEKIYVTSFNYSDNRIVFKHPREASVFKIENYFQQVILEPLIWTGVIVINKDCFENVGGFNTMLSRGEDLDLWSRLARNYPIIKSSTLTATYRLEAENRSDLIKNLERTHVYYLQLSEYEYPYEYNYHENEVLRFLYTYFRSSDHINFLKLKRKHPQVTYTKFINYSSSKVFNKVGRFFQKYTRGCIEFTN